jgi:hypothetical protein
MGFFWGFLAGVTTLLVVAIALAFVVFFLTPDEMEDEFALRVRDLSGGAPNPLKSVPDLRSFPFGRRTPFHPPRRSRPNSPRWVCPVAARALSVATRRKESEHILHFMGKMARPKIRTPNLLIRTG